MHVFFLYLISAKNLSIDKAVFSNFEGISSLIYSRILHFCLICMGLHNLVNCTEGKEESIFFSDIKSTSIFLLIICYGDSNLFRRLFMLSSAKTSLLMFLRRIFSKGLMGFRVRSSIKIWWNFFKWRKVLTSWIELPHDYAWVLSYLLLKQSNSFRFLSQYYYFYQRYINPAEIKICKYF